MYFKNEKKYRVVLEFFKMSLNFFIVEKFYVRWIVFMYEENF